MQMSLHRHRRRGCRMKRLQCRRRGWVNLKCHGIRFRTMEPWTPFIETGQKARAKIRESAGSLYATIVGGKATLLNCSQANGDPRTKAESLVKCVQAWVIRKRIARVQEEPNMSHHPRRAMEKASREKVKARMAERVNTFLARVRERHFQLWKREHILQRNGMHGRTRRRTRTLRPQHSRHQDH